MIKKNAFYFVSVISDMELPILPYRNMKTGKLLFPNGCFCGLYWWEELQLFLNQGGVIKDIYYEIEFKESDYLFKDFAEICKKKREMSEHEKIL